MAAPEIPDRFSRPPFPQANRFGDDPLRLIKEQDDGRSRQRAPPGAVSPVGGPAHLRRGSRPAAGGSHQATPDALQDDDRHAQPQLPHRSGVAGASGRPRPRLPGAQRRAARGPRRAQEGAAGHQSVVHRLERAAVGAIARRDRSVQVHRRRAERDEPRRHPAARGQSRDLPSRLDRRDVLPGAGAQSGDRPAGLSQEPGPRRDSRSALRSPAMDSRETESTVLGGTISEWLAEQALLDSEPAALYAELCQRLRGVGMPILRGTVTFRILHPLYAASAITWTADKGAVVGLFRLDDGGQERFQRSSFGYALAQRLPVLRRRLTGEAAVFDFPELEDDRALGGTDYLVVLVAFERSGGSGIICSWLGDRAQGFTDGEIVQLRRITRELGIAMKSRIERNVAHNVAHAYLGKRAGGAALI